MIESFEKSLVLKISLLVSLYFVPTNSFAEDSSGPGLFKKLFGPPMVTTSYGSEATWSYKGGQADSLKIDKGVSLHGSLDFTIASPLHITLGYFHSTFNALANFDWTEYNTGKRVQSSNVPVKCTNSGPYIGLKIIPFEDFFIHPYFEGGGTAGVFSVTYVEVPTPVQGVTIKLSDFEPYSGYYGEGGIEMRLFNLLSLGGGVRFTSIRTGKMVTLNKQDFDFEGTNYFVTLGVRF